MNKPALIILLGVTLFISAFALVDVFRLRFDQGDVYPPFSSFRADPMGTRAFYEALENMPGMQVERNMLDLDTLKLPSDSVLLLAGAVNSPDPEPLIEKLEQFMELGGRLIITLQPEVRTDSAETEGESEGETEGEGAPWPFGGGSAKEGEGEGEIGDKDEMLHNNEEKKAEEEKSKYERLMGYKMIDITERWGFEVGKAKFPKIKVGEVPTFVKLANEEMDLPKELAWLSSHYFLTEGKEWETVYIREQVSVTECECKEEKEEEINHKEHKEEGKIEKTEIKDVPVVLYRAWGKGSVILCSDSYFLSNEAIQRHRYPQLLAWLIGPYQHVIFNETQNGLVEQPGIIDFIRHYRLTGLLIVGILAGILFIWKNSMALVPRKDQRFTDNEIGIQSASDISDGLGALLKRSVPPDKLLKVCMDEYRNTYRNDPMMKGHLNAVFSEEITNVSSKETPRIYGIISKRIKERMLGRHE